MALKRDLDKKVLAIEREMNKFVFGSPDVRDGMELNWGRLSDLKCPLSDPNTEPEHQKRMELDGNHYVCSKCGFRLEKKAVDELISVVERMKGIRKPRE